MIEYDEGDERQDKRNIRNIGMNVMGMEVQINEENTQVVETK